MSSVRVLVLMASLVLVSVPLMGATINVGASDVTGLINAINTANGDGASDTIVLTNSTYALTNAQSFAFGPTGLPAITTPIIISGNGATITRGSGTFRIFYVAAGGTLTLDSLVISNGLAQGGNGGTGAGGGGGGAGLGGAIFNAGALTLNNCTLTGNQAIGGNGANANSSVSAGGGGGGMGFGGGAASANAGGGGGGTQSVGSPGIGGIGTAGGAGGLPAAGGGQNGGTPAGGGAGGTGNTGGGGGGSSPGGGVPDGGGGSGGIGGGGGGSAGGSNVGGTGGGNGGFGGGGGAGAYGGGHNGGTGGFGAGGGGASSQSGAATGGAGGLGAGSGGGVSAGQDGGGGGGAGMGGAIFNHGGTLVLNNTGISGNTAVGGTGGAGGFGGSAGGVGSPRGGGVFNNGGTVTLLGSTSVAGNTGGQNIEPLAPVVSTPTATGVGVTVATLGGNVSSDNGYSVTQRGIVFSVNSVNSNPLIGGTGVTAQTTTGSTGVFTIGISGLQPNTTYAYKAFATNLGGTGYTTTATFTTDPLPNVSSIVRAGANPTNAGSVSFTVTLGGAGVSGLTAANFGLTNVGVTGALITNVTGGGTTWTVTASTGTGDGSIRLDLNNSGGVTPGIGNLPFQSGQVYNIDKTPPGISISAPSVINTVTGPVDFTIAYTGADSVTLASGNISLNTTGSASGSVSVSGGGTGTRTVTISSITGSGSLGITIDTGTASDNAGNTAPGAGPSGTFTVLGPPIISIGAPSVTATAGGLVDFVVTYTNATSVTLTAGDVTLTPTGTVAGNVSVSGTGTVTRTVTVNGITGTGAFAISIAAGTASNGGGNAPAAGPGASVDVDNTAPVLTPGGTVSVGQGATATGATVGTVTDNLTPAGSLAVTATNVPTGLGVLNIVNTGGNITADIQAQATATIGVQQIEFSVTDALGNSSIANLSVDVAGNQAPTISAFTDQSIPMNTDTGALAFTIDDAEDGAAALILSATCDNQILLDPLTDFVFGGAGTSRTLTVTPQTNNVGAAIITVTVTDSANASSSRTFVLTVTDSVDAPAIAPISNIVIYRDQTSAVFNFTATDPQGDGTLGAPAGDSLNTTLIQGTDFTFGGTAPNLTFQITPQAGQVGTAVVIIYISDGTHTASRAFTVVVQDPPSSSGGGDDDDDEGCTTGPGSSMWLMLLAMFAALCVVLRVRRAI